MPLVALTFIVATSQCEQQANYEQQQKKRKKQKNNNKHTKWRSNHKINTALSTVHMFLRIHTCICINTHVLNGHKDIRTRLAKPYSRPSGASAGMQVQQWVQGEPLSVYLPNSTHTSVPIVSHLCTQLAMQVHTYVHQAVASFKKSSLSLLNRSFYFFRLFVYFWYFSHGVLVHYLQIFICVYFCWSTA